MPEHQQNPDGQWVPATPMDWDPGLDWEVSGPDASGSYAAVLYRRDVIVTSLAGRNRVWLAIRMRLRLMRLRLTGRV